MNTTSDLAFLVGDVNGRKLEVQLAQMCRIGRSRENDLTLDLDSVSRNHAIVYSSRAGVYLIDDLGSSNGTCLNGSRVYAPTRLKNGDCITIGICELRFRQQALRPVPDSNTDAGITRVFFAQKLITVLVADIRGFTALAQRLDPDILSRVTGTLFREAGTVLRERGAQEQKFIGDAVMAVWLHSECTGTEVADILAALASLAKIATGLQHRFGLDQPIRIGAGLNSGFASLGNVGSSACPDYTALGDTVNRAFRLESLTKDVGWDVALGEKTFSLLVGKELREIFRARSVKLKGYDEPVTAWGASFDTLLLALHPLREYRTNRAGI